MSHKKDAWHIWVTLFGPMDFTIKCDTFSLGWSIEYIEGSHVILIYSLEIDSVVDNSANPDEFIRVFTVYLSTHFGISGR